MRRAISRTKPSVEWLSSSERQADKIADAHMLREARLHALLWRQRRFGVVLPRRAAPWPRQHGSKPIIGNVTILPEVCRASPDQARPAGFVKRVYLRS